MHEQTKQANGSDGSSLLSTLTTLQNNSPFNSNNPRTYVNYIAFEETLEVHWNTGLTNMQKIF